MRHHINKIFVIGLASLLLFGNGVGAGFYLNGVLLDRQLAAAETALFETVWQRVETQYYGELPPASQAGYGAIHGALATLNDPYTLFLEPEQAAREQNHFAGQFAGLGVFIRPADDGQIHLDPMPDQPAARAGLQKDDALIAVDGVPVTAAMTIDQVRPLLRGETGSQVVLTVKRVGVAGPIDITIERAIIEIPSLSWRLLDEAPTIGYIQLTAFTERSGRELGQALADLSDQGAEAYILDLRNNGGGVVEAGR